jgi:DNA-binding transcriptional MocR family regulator
MKKLSELNSPLKAKNVLIILDDMVSDIKKNEHNPELAKLFYNRRHLINGTLSIILTS